MPLPQYIGPEFDFLARRDRVIEDAPTKKACVIATVRNEGVNLLEWIAHYRVIGFETIFVYSNGNTDRSEDLLDALARADVINLCWNVVPDHLSPQMKAYRHALWINSEVAKHEWAFPLDADEFLIPCVDGEPAARVGDWLDVIDQRHSPSAISVNWKWFSGDGCFEKSQGLCVERFRQAKPSSGVKTAFKLRDAVDIWNSHAPILRTNGLQINGDGDPIKAGSCGCPPVFRYGQVNHYWNKSFEEFFIRKHRGHGRPLVTEQRQYSHFFEWGRRRPDSPEPLPTSAFIKDPKDEMDRLRALPGVLAAEHATNERFREMLLENGGARAAYDATLRDLQNSTQARSEAAPLIAAASPPGPENC